MREGQAKEEIYYDDTDCVRKGGQMTEGEGKDVWDMIRLRRRNSVEKIYLGESENGKTGIQIILHNLKWNECVLCAGGVIDEVCEVQGFILVTHNNQF